MNTEDEMREMIKLLLTDINLLQKRVIIKKIYDMNETMIYQSNIIKNKKVPTKTVNNYQASNKLDDIIENIKSEELDAKLDKINKLYYKILSKK